MKMWVISILITFGLFGACQAKSNIEGSSSMVVGIDLSHYLGLEETIERYYVAEKNGKWKLTYQLRPQSFQKMVPFELYKREMQKGSAGWALQKVEIISVESKKDDEVMVLIGFTESFNAEVSKSIFDGRVVNGTNRSVEETIWRRSGDNWLCVQPAQRGHFPLNDRMVY